MDPKTLEAEIAGVRSLGLDALRARWRTMFAAQPPSVLPKDLLARMIAYRMQEEALGGLDGNAVKLLSDLGRGEKHSTKPRRRLKPGTILVREYQGERNTVTVVHDGYLWEGTTYTSLSTIARAITGTAWGGPRFFGLRSPGGGGEEGRAPDKPAAQPMRSGRTRTQGGGRADELREVQP